MLEDLNKNKAQSTELEYYWIVARDRNTGNVLNAYHMDIKSRNEETIIEKFESDHQYKYTVLEIGRGVKNRPEEVIDLPYIESTNEPIQQIVKLHTEH